ncbi:MAG: zinc metallopeptidase [Clostridia bacterium]|nr:zinc metallopeptidase [Clostridia bacterium]
MLNAAALTYVVAALSTLVSFLRLFMMAKNTRRR